MGVFAPLTGIIGAVQAAEALKLLCGAGDTLNGRLLLLDCLAMEWRSSGCPRTAGLLEIRILVRVRFCADKTVRGSRADEKHILAIGDLDKTLALIRC